jgi:hypothetical protein
VVKDLTTFDVEKQKTLDGVIQFLSANGLDGEFLLECAKAHYLSAYLPPRKAFDYYSALALTTWLRTGHTHKGLRANERVMYYSNVYGITYISSCITWEETMAEHSAITNTVDQPGDSELVRKKKKLFREEIGILKTIAYMGRLEGVYDVHFEHDASGLLRVSESTSQVPPPPPRAWVQKVGVSCAQSPRGK